MADTHRTFLAFQIPDEIREFAKRFQESLCEYGIVGKWVAPNNLHITTLFLGDQSDNQLATVKDITDRIVSGRSAFDLECVGIGSFKATPGLLYLGLAPDPPRAFTELASTLKTTLVDNHIRLPRNVLDQTPLPHLTLVRFRHRGEARKMRRLGSFRDSLWQLDESVPASPELTFTLDTLHLVKSRLTPKGPVYETLEEFKMK